MVCVDGVKLRRCRERRLMSLRDLSETSGVAFSTLQRIESGKQDPRPSTLRHILSALEVSSDEVLGFSDGTTREKLRHEAPSTGVSTGTHDPLEPSV